MRIFRKMVAWCLVALLATSSSLCALAEDAASAGEAAPDVVVQPVEEVKAEATPEATAEPAVEATPEATAEPAVEETPEATEEPAVEETPEATEEPAVEETPEATEEPAVEETPEATEEPAAEELFVKGYATVAANAVVYESQSCTNEAGVINAKAVVYVVDRIVVEGDDNDVMEIRFNYAGAIVRGYVEEADVTPMTEADISTYEANAKDAVEGPADSVLCEVDYKEAASEADAEDASDDSAAQEADQAADVQPAADQIHMDYTNALSTTVAVVGNVSAQSVDGESVKVTWGAVENAAGYKVYRSLQKSGGYAVVTTIQDGSTVEWTDTGLTTGTAYYYKIRAFAADSTVGGYSSAVSATPTALVDTVDAPANVAAASVDGTSIKVTWDAVEYATGYVIYRSLQKSGGYAIVATIEDGSIVEWTDTGLTTGTTYYYTMKAVAPSGKQSGYSAKVNAAPVAVIDTVDAPANVAAAGVDGTSIKVTWDAVENAVGYKIYRSLTVSGGYAVVATIEDGSIVEWTDTALETGTRYYYIMKAIAPSGKLSGYSLKVNATPVAVIDTVDAPANVAAASVDGTSIKVTWDAVENAVGYKIYRSLTVSGGYAVVATIEDGSVVEWTDTALETGTRYYYIMKAIAPSGKLSGYSLKVNAVPTTPVEVIDKVDAPVNVAAASVDGTSIKVTWDAVENAAGYKIYRSLTVSGGYAVVATIEDGSVVEWTDTGLETGTTYYYIMKATAPSGKLSGYSAKVNAVPTAPVEVIDKVDAPVNVAAASVDGTSIKVTWDAVENAAGYKIYRSLTVSGGYAVVATIEDGSVVEWTDTGLETGTTYYYIMKAIAPSGKLSGYSLKVNAAPVVVIDTVDAPANVAAASVDGTSIKVTWDAVENAAGYKIYRSLTVSGGYAVVATIEDGSVVEWTDTGLETGTTYYYTMKAIAPSGKLSGYSLKVNAAPNDGRIIVNDIVYKEYGTGLEVVGYTAAAVTVTIPSTVEGLPVIRVGESAFEGNTTLTSIDLPDTIEVIGKRAFANCTNLSDIH